MSRALIALCFAMQALPARYTADAVRLRAQAPLESSRRSVEVWSEGRQLATGTWLVDGRRSHVAFRNPLGQPTSILRIADGAVGLELVGVREIVAPDASLVLSDITAGALDAGGVAALVLGRLPSGSPVVAPFGERFVAISPGYVAELDREGDLLRAQIGRLRVEHRDDGVLLSDGVSAFRVVLGAPVGSPVPERAFRIGSEQSVPTVSTRRLGRMAGRRLLGL